MAAVRQQRLDDAQQHLDALRPLSVDPVMEKLTVWDRYPLAHATRIAERTVTAEIAAARGDHAAAIAALGEAVKIEDGIPYDEPPGWHAPVRQRRGVRAKPNASIARSCIAIPATAGRCSGWRRACRRRARWQMRTRHAASSPPRGAMPTSA